MSNAIHLINPLSVGKFRGVFLIGIFHLIVAINHSKLWTPFGFKRSLADPEGKTYLFQALNSSKRLKILNSTH